MPGLVPGIYYLNRVHAGVDGRIAGPSDKEALRYPGTPPGEGASTGSSAGTRRRRSRRAGIAR
jgi:hypothetical protein